MEEDKKLYTNFLNGDKNAFNNLISKYKINVIYFITRYVKDIDIAEDIFQDTSIYIWENKERYNAEYSFKTYLYTIAKSKALNYIDKNKIQNINLEDFENTLYENELLEEIVFSNERKQKIQRVISQLKTEYQIVIYLTQIEGLTYKETSKIMNKTEKQVKNLAYNAKKCLKRLLLKEEVIEIKHNKFIRLLSWLIIISVVTSGIVIAAKAIRNSMNNAKFNPSFTGSLGNVKENRVWVGTFQLAWNELMKSLGGPIEFEGGNPELVNDLNTQSFSKDMLNKNSYYIERETGYYCR